MIPKQFDAISKQDIEALVSNAVPEGRSIEYKQALPGSGDKEKKEFLADASSFPNASGGDIIYGVRDKKDPTGKPTGIPEAADGIVGINADQEIRRLEDMLRNGVEPRIPGVRLKSIPGFNAGPVILLRLPKSWTSPHLVSFQTSSRFFTRTSAGKHQMDVREIRAAFEITSSLKTRIETFRAERLAKIQALETPVPVSPWPKCILHLFPFASADHTAQTDDVTLRAYELPILQPFYNMQTPRKLNFDGVVSYAPFHNGTTYAYAQVFRNGIIEGVFNCSLLDLKNYTMTDEQRAARADKVLSSRQIEGYARKGATDFLETLKKLDQQPPIVLMLSLVGVKDMELAVESPWRAYEEHAPIDRDVLPLPEAIIDSFDIPIDDVLRQMFDVAWQASGQPRSRNYNHDGRWDGGLSAMQGNV
ncbi:MAG TPA: ATP-binding protein [Verrucomicrobiae bacterium]|nr:ATP-binding protein [Verrucomicrobiae bacterium]